MDSLWVFDFLALLAMGFVTIGGVFGTFFQDISNTPKNTDTSMMEKYDTSLGIENTCN